MCIAWRQGRPRGSATIRRSIEAPDNRSSPPCRYMRFGNRAVGIAPLASVPAKRVSAAISSTIRIRIVPRDAASPSIEPTALDRREHESARGTPAANGRLVIRLGAAERGELACRHVAMRPIPKVLTPTIGWKTAHPAPPPFLTPTGTKGFPSPPETIGLSKAEICIQRQQAGSPLHPLRQP